jgi:hypothetical protein
MGWYNHTKRDILAPGCRGVELQPEIRCLAGQGSVLVIQPVLFFCCCISMSSAVQKHLTTAGFGEPSFGLSSPSAMAPSVQQQQQEAQSSVMKAGIDLTAGTVAGVAQLIVGHPFDTIKVSGVQVV